MTFGCVLWFYGYHVATFDLVFSFSKLRYQKRFLRLPLDFTLQFRIDRTASKKLWWFWDDEKVSIRSDLRSIGIESKYSMCSTVVKFVSIPTERFLGVCVLTANFEMLDWGSWIWSGKVLEVVGISFHSWKIWQNF